MKFWLPAVAVVLGLGVIATGLWRDGKHEEAAFDAAVVELDRLLVKMSNQAIVTNLDEEVQLDIPFWEAEALIGARSNALEIWQSIAIGEGAVALKDHELVITFQDGTEMRIDLPTNTTIRGFKNF